MEMPGFLAGQWHRVRTVWQLACLPVARLRFEQCINPDAIRRTYALFTRPHARYRIIGNKTLGVALIDLRQFAGNPFDYLESVQRSGHAGPQSRKAAKRGYRLREIDRNDHIEEIHAIHVSSDERQGRPMDEQYRVKKTRFEPEPHFESYGVFDACDRLVAYCNMGRYGNFVATDQLMGYKNKDGIMYLLLLSIVCRMIERRGVEYFMYDTYLGAKPGLQDFKRRVGFRPYRARYVLA